MQLGSFWGGQDAQCYARPSALRKPALNSLFLTIVACFFVNGPTRGNESIGMWA
jgi:hypothetical protein